MSAVALLQGIYARFAAGDAAALVAALDKDVVWVEPDMESLPYRGVTTGAEAVAERVIARIASTYDHLRFAPERWIEGENFIGVLGTGSAKGEGGEFTFRFAHLFTLKGGKITRMDGFADTHRLDQALRPAQPGRA